MSESKAKKTISDDSWKVLALHAALCGFLLVAAILFEKIEDFPSRLTNGLYILSMVIGGWKTAGHTLKALQKKKLDINFLMLAVAVGASIIGAWQEGALLLFLFSTSGALEDYAMNRMSREITALTKAAPKTAQRIASEGKEESYPVESLKAGHLIIVRPDEIFPVDAVIVKGATDVDESNLTGEAIPVAKKENDEVHSGTLNSWGIVTLKVLRPVNESSLARIIRMIQEAQKNRAPSQRLTDRFGSRYAIGVLVFSFLMFFVWWLYFGLAPFTETAGKPSAFYRSMALLVVSSPCALVLSIPSAILAGIAWGARHGILFRGGGAIEQLTEITTIALDKTGTLTAGKMEVTHVQTFPAGNEDHLLELVYSVEKESNHPIARAITKHCEKLGTRVKEVTELKSLTGLGIQARISGEIVKIGRKKMIEASEQMNAILSLNEDAIEKTEVWISTPSLIGRILLEDEIRAESQDVMQALGRRGITTVMLTGDNRSAAHTVAKEIGITEVHADLHPEDKVTFIQKSTKDGQKVAMVGDGVNDAPSLAAAHVSISMGGRGSDAALEQSDVVLMNDQIEKLESAFALSKMSRTVIRQNLILSLGTILVMVISTLIWSLPLALAVIIHESSTVFVCLNSLRILFLKEK